MAISKDEVTQLARDIESKLKELDLPKDLTYVIQLFGPKEAPHYRCIHNEGKQTAKPVRKYLKTLYQTMTSKE